MFGSQISMPRQMVAIAVRAFGWHLAMLFAVIPADSMLVVGPELERLALQNQEYVLVADDVAVSKFKTTFE